jgi:preprotein translocase subunit SecA
MPIRSGTKNVYVSIERYADSRDTATNALVPVWSQWKPGVFCSAQPMKGREIAIGDTIVRETYMRFTFDYLDIVGITALDVIVYEDARYDIKGLLPDLVTKENFMVDATASTAGHNRA